MGAIFHEEDDLYKCHSYYRFYLLCYGETGMEKLAE